MYGSFETQKMRRTKPKEDDPIKRDPKRDKHRKNTYDFQRSQKRQQETNESYDCN